jgi:hypothetical protein
VHTEGTTVRVRGGMNGMGRARLKVIWRCRGAVAVAVGGDGRSRGVGTAVMLRTRPLGARNR